MSDPHSTDTPTAQALAAATEAHAAARAVLNRAIAEATEAHDRAASCAAERREMLEAVASGADRTVTPAEMNETRARAQDGADLADIARARVQAAETAVHRAEIESLEAFTSDFHARVAAGHAVVHARALALDAVMSQAREALAAFKEACEATYPLMVEASQFTSYRLPEAVAGNPVLAGMRPGERPSVPQAGIHRRGDHIALTLTRTDGQWITHPASIAALFPDPHPRLQAAE